jgi:hypothetical protein
MRKFLSSLCAGLLLAASILPLKADFVANELIGFGATTEETAATLTTFTFIVSATGTSATISFHASRQAGDLAIIFDASTPSAAHVTPSLFTILGRTNSSDLYAGMYGKILDGTETTVTGMATTPTWVTAIFRPDAPISAFAVNSLLQQGTASNPTAQVVTSSATASYPIINLCMLFTNNTLSPRITSPTMNELSSGNTQMYGEYYIQTASAVDVTCDMNDQGVNVLQSLYLTFTSP